MNIEKIKKYSIYSLFITLLNVISRKRKFELILLLFLMIISSFAEIFSLATVIPFITILNNPENLWNYDFVQKIVPVLGINSPKDLLIPVTFLFIFSTILSAILRLSTFWFNGKLAAKIGSEIGFKVYFKTLHQSYEKYIERNSSGLIAALNLYVTNVISFFNLLLTFTSSILLFLSVIITLLIIDLKIAISMGFIMFSAYLLIGYLVNSRLINNSRKMNIQQIQSTKIIQEGFGAYRDIILENSQKFYLERFRRSDFPLRKLNAESNFLGAFPKFVLEALGISLISFLGLLLIYSQNEFTKILPLLAAFAIGAQKILPASQNIYSSWAAIKASKGSIEIIVFLLSQPIFFKTNSLSSKRFKFEKDIVFKDVSYSYDNSSSPIIKNLNFQIKKGEKVGIIGKTGSGKSTTIDLLMGLLNPIEGKILIDNKHLNINSSKDIILRWHKCIAHVPQSIFLADSTIAENIAFGEFKEKIDLQLVKRAAKQAQISDYIESIPKNYYTVVGERGIKLSGGQRQRIGIARALYKGAKILILDEATSALDETTENKLMNTINQLDSSLTVVMITHRINTIKNFNKLIKLNKGLIEAIGEPNEVLKLI